MQWLVDIGISTWQVTGLMAPYLLLGFAVAGILWVWVSPAFVERHLGGRGVWQVCKAALLGVPLPLCSCGVIPVAASLRRQGASRGATVSFLASTPQTGIDSILATHALLGPVFAVFRILVAFVSGFVSGVLTDRLDPDNNGADAALDLEDDEQGPGSGNRFLVALRYGFGQLPQDIARALVLGVIISGLITVLIPAESLPEMATTGLSAMVLMMLVGMPLYICSTASIPVAFAFMNMGVSPGAALVFLVTGPATNAAAMTTMWRVLGRRAWFVYLATIVVCAFLAGILLDALSGTAGLQEAAVAVGPDCHLSWFQQAAAVVLVIILLPGLVPQRWRRRKDSACCAVSDRDSCAQTPSGPGAAAQAIEGFEFLVSGMRCSHCVATVTRVLSATPGVRGVDVDLESGRVRVVGPAPDASRLVAEIEKLGYTVTGTPAPIRESGV